MNRLFSSSIILMTSPGFFPSYDNPLNSSKDERT